MPDFSIDFAYLVASWCEAVLWGVYGVLFALCLWLVFNHGKLHPVQLTAMILLYVLATCHISLDFARLIEGFIFTESGQQRIAFFSNVALRINVAKDFLYVTSALIVWRCWIVWSRNWNVVAFPIILIFGEAVSGYGAIGQYLSPDLATDTSIKPWGTALFSLSLATNVLVTSLTVGRIWWISRAAHKLRSGRSPSLGAIIVIIESGLAITLAKIIEFTAYQIAFAGTVNVQVIYVMFEVMPQLFGIIPIVILLSIQIGLTSSRSYMPSGPRSFTRSTTLLGPARERNLTSFTGCTTQTMPTLPEITIQMDISRDPDQRESEPAGTSLTPPTTERKTCTDSSGNS
ncbi:hypothetical protein CALVIDRAFT_599764 [Calocera viscosa TUFC12733]|uniref:RTA1-domain-containing protein n=1 Tax=Calocera viscosa (strain TUFC12733) TaxID=1330018 RepID=A0A167KJ80_CALVF|nr:hypothetical protein CALVIDRAFT_599764 [Calocera viscosa TUFC12733]